jgi:GTP-binding protein HflX
VVYDQIQAVFAVLGEIGIDEKETLLAFNKIDAATNVDSLLRRYPNAIPISARHGIGLDRLAHSVSDALSRSFMDIDVDINVGNGRAMAFVAAHGEVLSRRYDGERVTIHCRLPRHHLGRLSEEPDMHIRQHDETAMPLTTESATPTPWEEVA